MEHLNHAGYVVSDDHSRLDTARVAQWLAEESYWAVGRPNQTVRDSIDGSLCFGLYAPSGSQVGFCRWVTDRATFAWLCDVYVETGHAGGGLGKWMIGLALDHPFVRDIKLRVLATSDAHELYAQFGFQQFDPDTASHWMRIPPRTNEQPKTSNRKLHEH